MNKNDKRGEEKEDTTRLENQNYCFVFMAIIISINIYPIFKFCCFKILMFLYNLMQQWKQFCLEKAFLILNSYYKKVNVFYN